MPNDYFTFKQFTVHQRHCAMKVCTDACLFGAWAANIVTTKKLPAKYVLDIGAGTGLLSLMLAQQLNGSIIHAAEADKAAAVQAIENCSASLWKDRVYLFNTTIQSFLPEQPYNFIISNPPFFQNDLASQDVKRNMALHSHQLSFNELLIAIQQHLCPDGHFAVLLPCHRTQHFENMATAAGYFLQQKTLVQQTPIHSNFRSMLLFGTEQTAVEKMAISIKEDANSYTAAFRALLKDYYLYL